MAETRAFLSCVRALTYASVRVRAGAPSRARLFHFNGEWRREAPLRVTVVTAAAAAAVAAAVAPPLSSSATMTFAALGKTQKRRATLRSFSLCSR